MKIQRYLIILLVPITFAFQSSTKKVQSPVASDIVGTYWTAEKDAKVRIFLAANGKYSGKTVWMKEPNNANGSPKLDVNNPNEKLRSRERMNLVFLKYFAFDEDDQRWEGGTVYDPRSGKTYDGYIRFEGNDLNTLYLRGYIAGMTWLGKTSEWTRVQD